MTQAEPMTKKEFDLSKAKTGIEMQIHLDTNDKQEGYKVVYPNDYESWCPKAVFEAANMQIGDNCTITQDLVDNFIDRIEIQTMGDKTTVVKATLINGFVIVESSSCVDPVNHDEPMGVEICVAKIKDKVWELLGFLLQTARYGIRRDA